MATASGQSHSHTPHASAWAILADIVYVCCIEQVLACSQVYWTNEVTAAIQSGGGPQALEEYVTDTLEPQLQQIVMLVRGKLDRYVCVVCSCEGE